MILNILLCTLLVKSFKSFPAVEGTPLNYAAAPKFLEHKQCEKSYVSGRTSTDTKLVIVWKLLICKMLTTISNKKHVRPQAAKRTVYSHRCLKKNRLWATTSLCIRGTPFCSKHRGITWTSFVSETLAQNKVKFEPALYEKNLPIVKKSVLVTSLTELQHETHQ